MIKLIVNEPGTTVLKDARPMRIGGQPVYVTIDNGVASLNIEGRAVAIREADDMTMTEAKNWAIQYRDAMNETAAAIEADAREHMEETYRVESIHASAVQRIHEDGASLYLEADQMAADAPEGTHRYYSYVQDKVIKFKVSDPRHPARVAETLKRQAEILMAWTAEDESGYMRYITNGLADTDGHFVPMHRDAWKRRQD